MKSTVSVGQRLVNRMSLYRDILKLFGPRSAESRGRRGLQAPPVRFATVIAQLTPPQEADLREFDFYFVKSSSEKPRWVLFKCPCGCGSVVTLSLQSAHRPSWRLRYSRASRPTLLPSVWRDAGCLSHFWIEDGRVYWCSDTGVHPQESRYLNDERE